MLTLKDKQKAEALQRMKMLKLLDQVQKDFRTNGRLYYSERLDKVFNAVLYWLDNQSQYVGIVERFEKEYNALVYHCQLTHTEFGDQLTILYVSANENEWENDRKDLINGYAFARVENLLDGMYSEFGSVGIAPSMGGVLRTY